MSLNPQSLGNGQEQYEYFRGPKRMGLAGVKRCQYDYRHTDGTLFSCVAPSLEAAHKRRNTWLETSKEPRHD